MNSFKLLLATTGLSLREAGDFLKISPSSVDKMNRGKIRANENIIGELSTLAQKQMHSAHQALESLAIAEPAPDEIELGFPADDYEAQTMGWPCVGAWAGMAAHFVAGTQLPVNFVPRGSTLASAAAAAARDNVN